MPSPRELAAFFAILAHAPHHDKDGLPMTTLEINTDLAEWKRKRAEQERRESDQLLRLALKAAQMGIWCFDLETGAQVFRRRRCSWFRGSQSHEG